MAALVRYGACRAAVVAVALVGTTTSAFASAACDAINSGAWNVNIGSIGAATSFTSQLTFDVGETVRITSVIVNATGDYALTGSSLLITYLPIPGTLNYTVTGLNGDRTLQVLFSSGTFSSSINLTVTCGAAPKADVSQALTKGFLQSRINGILLNDPTSVSLLNRSNPTSPTNIASAGSGNTSIASGTSAFGSAMGLGSGLGHAMGLGAGRLDDGDVDTTGSQSVQFSQSLSGMRRQAAQLQMQKDRMALGAGDGGALPLSYAAMSPWDIWVEGRYSAFDDNNGNLDRNGHVGVLYFGGDYRVTENMIVGVLAQYDWAKDESSVLASDVSGNGWMVGPYLSARVHHNIHFDLRAAWGRSSNDLTLGATTGDFDTSRWLVKGALAGNWMHDAWRFTPSADLAYITESADSFTNSAGTFVAGQDVSLGRLQFGPEIGYRFAHTQDTFIEPFAALKGVWDFDNPNVAIIDGFVVGPGDFWGRLQGGLNVATSSGWYVRGLASWDGVGADDYSGYTLQGTVNVPLN
jgi:outer membrane autotransporter protein